MGNLVDYRAGCYECDKHWESRNCHGLAAQHHYKTGHATWVELGYAYTYGTPPNN